MLVFVPKLLQFVQRVRNCCNDVHKWLDDVEPEQAIWGMLMFNLRNMPKQLGTTVIKQVQKHLTDHFWERKKENPHKAFLCTVCGSLFGSIEAHKCMFGHVTTAWKKALCIPEQKWCVQVCLLLCSRCSSYCESLWLLVVNVKERDTGLWYT